MMERGDLLVYLETLVSLVLTDHTVFQGTEAIQDLRDVTEFMDLRDPLDRQDLRDRRDLKVRREKREHQAQWVCQVRLVLKGSEERKETLVSRASLAYRDLQDPKGQGVIQDRWDQ